jgi:hypothetical protein
MTDKIQRFDIPAGPTIIDTYRAFRAFVEQIAARRGRPLDPAWYRDSPLERPELYSDQPDLLEPEQ